MMIASILDRVFRREGGRMLASLIRFTGDFDLAEDALQDAFARALVAWARDGLPENPGAWLATTAQRASISCGGTRSAPWANCLTYPIQIEVEEAGPVAISGVEDNRLRLLFTCCHPASAGPAGSALALRTLGGLSTRDIARALVESEVTAGPSASSAPSKRSATHGFPTKSRRQDDLSEHLAAVLACVYLIFNEGHTATEGSSLHPARPVHRGHWPRAPGGRAIAGGTGGSRAAGTRPPDQCARQPDHERWATRSAEEQDRSLWEADKIRDGTAILDAALPFHRPGPYQIQARDRSSACERTNVQSDRLAPDRGPVWGMLRHAQERRWWN